MANKSRSKDIRVDKALEFSVSKGIHVEFEMCACGRKFSPESVNGILAKYKKFTDNFGCYIYAIKAGKGFTPIYIGSATKQSLGKESFDGDKLLKCLQHMASYLKGSLQITFIVPKDKIADDARTRRGRCPAKTIWKLEKVLTAVAYRKNNNLVNKHNHCLAEFFINGAMNSDAGRPRKDVVAFKEMMGLCDKFLVVV